MELRLQLAFSQKIGQSREAGISGHGFIPSTANELDAGDASLMIRPMAKKTSFSHTEDLGRQPLTRVGIDLTQIPFRKTGVGWYTVNLVQELLKLNQEKREFEYVFFFQDDDPQWNKILTANPTCRPFPIPAHYFRFLPLRCFFEQIMLPRHGRMLSLQYIFSPHYTMPYLTRIRRIVTFHDMSFYLFPKMHQWIKRLYFKALIPLSLRFSHRIIAITAATADEIRRFFPSVAAEKIAVIHLGVHPAPAVASTAADSILAHFHLRPKRYVLFIGTLEPRKNIAGLIKAFQQLYATHKPWRNFKLVIVGRSGWLQQKIFRAAAQKELAGAVVFTDYLAEESKNALLAQAFIFVYPSFHEGFGMPVLEAMAHGIPVITGNTSAFPEIAAGAALLVDSHQPWEISAALERLRIHPELRKKLSVAGRKRSQEYDWRRTAELTAALFRE